MYISLLDFGRELRNMRRKLNLTQNDVSTLTGINTETLRRIEGGKVLPKFETLAYLSVIYKHDLNSIFLKYRFNDFAYLFEVKNKLESKFDRDEFHTLNIELIELNTLLGNIDNSYFKDYLTQLSLLTDAVILYKDEDKDKEAFDRLIKALIITTPTFNLENYKALVYSPMEIRILMNIAFVLNKLNNNSKYLEILEFCIKSVDKDNEMYPKLCHNLAGAYTRSKDYKKALNYSNMGIKASQINRNSNGLNILYYGKGIAEYQLGKSEYKESILTAIYLCKAIGQEKLNKKIIYNCKEIFKMDIEL